MTGLNNTNIVPLSDSGFAGNLAENRIDVTYDFAFLIGCHGRLARLALHPPHFSTSSDGTGNRVVAQRHTRIILYGNIDAGILSG